MWSETRSRQETRSQKKRQGFATVQLSTTEFLGESDTDRKKSFRKGKTSQHAWLFFKVIVRKGMLVITGIHLSVSFIKKGIANLGASARTRLEANERTNKMGGDRWNIGLHPNRA